MQSLSLRNCVAVAALPPATTALAGVTVRLLSDNKPYWCDGTYWHDLTATAAGGADLLYVGESAPSVPGGTAYAWIQTNVDGAGGMTMWVEDGL